MRKITRFLQQRISPIWAIVVIVVLAVLIATGFLVYGYFWSPNGLRSQSQDVLKMKWNFYSFNGNELTFKYPSRVCSEDLCYSTWIMDLDDAKIIGQNRKENVIEPVFKIYYKMNISRIEAENNIKNIYNKCEVRLWSVGREDKASVYFPNFITSCGRVFVAYSEKLNSLIMFDLDQVACIFDCKIDDKFIQSISLDGVEVFR